LVRLAGSSPAVLDLVDPAQYKKEWADLGLMPIQLKLLLAKDAFCRTSPYVFSMYFIFFLF
jgi:hypothetical protein